MEFGELVGAVLGGSAIAAFLGTWIKVGDLKGKTENRLGEVEKKQIKADAELETLKDNLHRTELESAKAMTEVKTSLCHIISTLNEIKEDMRTAKKGVRGAKAEFD